MTIVLTGVISKIQKHLSYDDEVQDCIEEAEDLGGNLGDYEILECVDEYD